MPPSSAITRTNPHRDPATIPIWGHRGWLSARAGRRNKFNYIDLRLILSVRWSLALRSLRQLVSRKQRGL